MTVRQLIKVLENVENQDLRIMIGGYEGGFNDIVTDANNIQFMALNVHEEWYYGDHEKAEDVYEGDLDKYQIIKAILL